MKLEDIELAFPYVYKWSPKNCPQCGLFMSKAGLEQHPDNDNEIYERLECSCGQVDHDFIGIAKEVGKE
jgi:hypothetical protein